MIWVVPNIKFKLKLIVIFDIIVCSFYLEFIILVGVEASSGGKNYFDYCMHRVGLLHYALIEIGDNLNIHKNPIKIQILTPVDDFCLFLTVFKTEKRLH
jgi:hypothetical protein